MSFNQERMAKVEDSEEIVTYYLAASVRLVGGDCHLWEMNTIPEGNLYRSLAHLP